MSVLEKRGVANVLELIPSARSITNPVPYGSNANEEEKEEYRGKLAEHTDEWRGLQAGAVSFCTEVVWSDFTCDFFPVETTGVSSHAVNPVRNLLLEERTIFRTQRRYLIEKALLECWKADKCPLLCDGHAGNGTLGDAKIFGDPCYSCHLLQ